MNCIQVIALIVVVWANSGSAQIQVEKHNNIDGGRFTSPGYPNNYPNNMNMTHYVKAPRNHIIVLHFQYFKFEGLINGLKVDYLRILDGKKSDDPEPQYFYGWLNPFFLVSNTNRLRIRMITDSIVTRRGFRASYSFLDTMRYCDVTTLANVTSCANEGHGYATQCTVMEKECGANYQQAGSVASCVNGSFTNTGCTLIEHIVRRCENDTDSCPYTLDEIVEYYEQHDLPADPNLSEIEIQLEQEQIANITDNGRSAKCPQNYCRRMHIPNYEHNSPRHCGRLWPKWRKLRCTRCRFNKCGFITKGNSG